MKKRLLFITLCLTLALSLCAFASGCLSPGGEGSSPNYSGPSPDTTYCEHNYGDWVSNGDGKHTKTCSYDSSHAITEDCSGGTATCTEKPACSVCGQKYGSALGHNYGDWVSNGDGTHTKTCSNDSSHAETEDCSGGTATCAEKPTCSVCGQKYGSALGHNYENGFCTNENCDATDLDYVAVDETYTKEGNYVYFGSYPQTEVKDDTLISALNQKSGSLPIASEFNGWTSYEYYINSSNSSAFMWYKDVTYGGAKYRGVYFTSYRPFMCDLAATADNTYQDDNGYSVETCYWFKYEPIKWRVLTEQDGKAFLFCDIVIDNQEYYDNTSTRTINGSTVYANNYKHSNIRAWLNDSFFNTAFNATQKELIQTTLVDNSARSTNLNDTANKWNNGKNEYACANTNDKIFLLSQQEITNTAYGFGRNSDGIDETRQIKSTDYAKVQGCYVQNFGDTRFYGQCNFYLRSPHYNNACVWYGAPGGDTCNNNSVTSNRGVLPALWLTLN